MNTPANVSEFPVEPRDTTPRPMSPTRPMFWSVQRELWENRSIYIAPAAVAAVVLFASCMTALFTLPRKIRALETLDALKQHSTIVAPFSMAPAPIMLAAFIVGVFYSLDALYGERRDRSILFWKSLPVSDTTTVLSKATIPVVVLPLVSFVLGVVTLFILLFQSTAVLLANGLSPAPLWRELQFVQEPLVMLYGLTVHSLWFAPIYTWMLLVSAWAPRATFLWAVLPLLAVAAVERIAFNTTYFASLLQYRLGGAMKEAFVIAPKAGQHQVLDQLTQLDPMRFLMSPGLWLGLMFAAACLVLAIRLRRYREPI